MVVGQSGDLILAAKFHFLHTQMLAVNEQSKFLQTNAVSSTINFFFFLTEINLWILEKTRQAEIV